MAYPRLHRSKGGGQHVGNDEQNSAAERFDAARVIAEDCSRAVAACVDTIDASGAVGVRDKIYAMRNALQRLHTAAATAFEKSSRRIQHWTSAVPVTDGKEHLREACKATGRTR